jgi:IclR family transcriptional regulator, acetate operon repressor
MSNALERGLRIIELLAGHDLGLPLNQIADTLDIPRSATHRLLSDLIENEFVIQLGELGNYSLSLKLVGIGQRHLASFDIVQLCQPTMKELADTTGELVRLAVRDGDKMLWVAQSQGARHGLRYDPEAGAVVTLSCSATGIAWMSTLPEEIALQRILRQGIGAVADFGPNAPQSIEAIRAWLREARDRGYATQTDTYAIGLSSVAAPIWRDGRADGVMSISGPSARLTEQRRHELSRALLQAAASISGILGMTSNGA